ncbi:MAG: T9SS type A sorting domain-containing protein [Muribaculaceae bacterium]|nr:T9SS type A sorting domain-containing protein [Muribaculaceae bacterium]
MKIIKEVRLQPLNYVGKIEIEKVTIYPVADTGVRTYAAGDPSLSLQLNDGSAAGEGYIVPNYNGTTLSATSTSVSQKFYVFKDIELPAGTYNMTGTYAAEQPGKVRVYFGSPSNPQQSNLSIIRTTGESINHGIGTLTVPEGETITGDLIFELRGADDGYYNYNFDLKNVTITANTQAVADAWNYRGAIEFTNYAMSYKPVLGNDKLTFEHGWRRFKVRDNLNLKVGSRYKLIARLKGTEAGKVTVKLGGLETEFDVTEEYKEVAYTFNFTDKPTTQFCEIIRPDSYNGSLYIDYIGFEETVSNGKAFNEDGYDGLGLVTSELNDGELNVKVPAPSEEKNFYEVVLISNVAGIKDKTTYGVTARVVYSGTPDLKIKFGGQTNPLMKDAEVRTISTKDGLTEAELRVVFTKEELSEKSINGGFIVLNVSNQAAGETLRLKSVKLWEPSEEFHGKKVDKDDDREQWSMYTSGRVPLIEKNGEELVALIDPVWTQFIAKSSIDLKSGKKYTLVARMRADRDADGNEQKVNAELGSWSVGTNKQASIPSEFGDVEFKFDPIDLSNGMLRIQIGAGFVGKLEIEKMSLVFDDSENIIDYAKESSNPNPALDSYPAPEVNVGTKQLEVRPYYKPFKVTKELDFNPRYNYTVTANVNSEKSGALKVSLANDSFSEDMTEKLTGGDNYITVGPFPAVTASEGFLVFQPMADLGNITVSNVNITYSLPDAEGQPLASDYFDVVLETPLSKDGKYSFHIGYSVDDSNQPMPETPTRFIVQGLKNGKYVNLGQYDANPDVSNADKVGNMFMDTYDVPLSVGETYDNQITNLRFICTENVGNSTGIVVDGDSYANGKKIRMTRFAVYKQSEFLRTDEAKDRNWVVPVITRFQIESMGQRYAYPGPRLRDMIDVNKTYDPVLQLFDGDFNSTGNNTYWDTTLPYNKEAGVAAEGGQNRDYGTDNITSLNDYIDILLPQFKKPVKKYNGSASSDGRAKNQVVIVLKRASGNNNHVKTINDDDLRRYTGLADNDPFLDKSNGFPLEIRYQGITRDLNKSANDPIVGSVAGNVEVLRFPNVEDGDSIRFALDLKEGWNGIRLMCLENTGKIERKYGQKEVNRKYRKEGASYDMSFETIKDPQTVSGTRIMRMSEIRAYMEIPKVDLESEDGRQDFHKLYNVRENLDTYNWEHTQGIIDLINNPPFGGDKNYMIYGKDPETNEEKNWQDVIESYKPFFDKEGLAYPDFNYITNPFDDEDVVPSNRARRNKDDYNNHKRQQTYTVLHEVYALPGERVDLYPYSDIWNYHTGYNYEDQFVRWYDYLTDKTPEYLYFFSEPKSAIKTPDGFIGGKTLLDHGFRGKGSVASVYFDKASYDNKDANLYYTDENGKVRMMDNWVAADFSLTFNTNLAERLGKNTTTWQSGGTKITEPIVTFRHLFHIQSASVFADKNMGDHVGNRKYVNSNRRYISTFADKTFKIRLEQAMPLDANTKSPFYYKTTENGKDEYKRVRGYEIFTYYLENPRDGKQAYNEDNYALTGISGKGIDKLRENSIFRVIDGEEERMFEPDDQPFMHIDSYVEADVDPANWLRDNKEFARSIQCRKTDAKRGKYRVRIYGKDSDGNIIRLKGEGNTEWPLVIAEYDVEFLDDTHASFVPEEDIPAINANPGHKYYSHMERYLERRYGATSDMKAVNFDQYTILKKDKVEATDVNGVTKEVNFKRFGFFEETGGDLVGSRLKLPIRWADSNYGFGYTTMGDYNMFRLADHSVMTPYKAAAQARTDNPVDTETGKSQTGTYDRLFYNTGGKEKGLFYYVNAASDPGDIVRIDFDELCKGSTIYVSAWVNEFNTAQPETANVIFNFYGNVGPEGADGKVKENITRTEQLHGFATGYVKRNPEDDYENGGNTGGDQGKWMHVYYSFVVDKSHADLEPGEDILSYSLVLENNSMSSAGADYAIDDVRAYVVSPRVEAEQVGSLCEKDDRNIDIEVRLPLETLVQSVRGQEDPNGLVHLQYSIVDKTKYDDKLEERRAAREVEGKELQTDDYYEAFATGVMHYPHDNIVGGTDATKKALSWGTIDFYPDYESDNQIDGSTTIAGYMSGHIEEIDGEKYFTFITHPVSKDGDAYNEFVKSHRNYYIVVDNLGTNTIFKDLPGVNYGTDRTNADVYPDMEHKGDWATYDKELAKSYQICTTCARMAEFNLKSAAQIVIDGLLHEDGENITCCENQRPVIQLNLKTKKKDENGNVTNDDLTVVDKDKDSENPYLDWWTGRFEDFAEETSKITENGQFLTLWDVLDYFRNDYPDVDTWDMPTVEEKKEGETMPEKYSNAMRNWLKELCATTKVNDHGETVPVEPKLILHQSSYVFPQSKTVLGKDELWKDIYVTAIPKATPTEIEDADGNICVICTQPREVKITVTNTSPTLFNGFSEIEYPAEIEDVPLRAGLKQLDYVTDGTLSKELYIPLRNMRPATDDVTSFLTIKEERDEEDNNIVTREADEFVYLVETNDPAYRQLSDYVPDPDRKDDVYDVDTRIAGKVQNISVKFAKDGDIYKATETPMARIVFYKDPTTNDKNTLPMGVNFREGYYYKFKFNFEEASSPSMEAAGYEEKCQGQTVFSIKVVPEYQVWTGDSSLNWNNDANWRRVHSKDDLMASAANGLYGQDGKSRYTTDGDNANTHSYAPMEFTKVIIPAGAFYPQLASRDHSRIYISGAEEKAVDNGSFGVAYKNPYTWTPTAPNAIPAENMTITDKYNVGEHKEATHTQPTVYINYDMAAVTYTYNNNYNVYCRPWYANACEQIHFDSNAEILNQQYLDYEKAWVDMEMTPHRWYNVASPLYGVVAGDMYLPTEDAAKKNTDPGRQMTELFAPITYDKDLNDRFAPAVYQRGWDKGSETVYTIHNQSSADIESVALASTWSHVYNDVTEEYAPGMGFSVKTDVTRLSNFQSTQTTEGETVTETPAEQTLVKFRFPKNDGNYNYFEDGNDEEGEVNHRPLTRGKAGKLFEMTGDSQEITLKKATSGNLFLVGNPFMAHLDMAKFLAANNNIESKFWILSEGQGQVGVVMDRKSESDMITNMTAGIAENSTIKDDYSSLAPMQGFFVQAKTAGTELKIKFTPDMMAVEPYADETGAPILKAPRPETRADGEDIISVSTSESTAIIRLSGSADKGYATSEDVEMIDDSNQRGIRRIYTVAGTMASAINQTPDADGVEVGLMAPTDSVTVVTFRGLALEDYMLYDTTTGEKTQLYDGFELEMTGSVSGRYFLTNGVDTTEIEDGTIRIMPERHGVVVTAPAVCGALTVRVYDTLGREVAKSEGFEQETRIALDPGIYVVEAIGSETGRKSAKLSIR